MSIIYIMIDTVKGETMKITVYSTATCPYCVMVKRWLDGKGIGYEDIRVDSDREAARKMVELSGQMGVPFTTIEKENGTIDKILGFDTASLSRSLGVA